MIRGLGWFSSGMVGSLVMLSTAVAGQTSSDSSVRARTVPVREGVEQEAESAPYRLGPLKVTPVFELRDAGYNNNVLGTESNQVSDLSATIAGGANVLSWLGSKMAVRGSVVPEYTWYDKLAERRGWGGAYGSSLLGLFNRMTFEAGGLYRSQVSLVSSESERTAHQTQTSGLARLEVEVLDRLSLFGGLDAVRTRYDDSGFTQGASSTADVLDRTDLGWRAGIRYRFLEPFALGAQLERSRAEFVHEAPGRDNASTGYSLVARYDWPRFYVDASGGYREGKGLRDAETGTPYPAYRTGTYSYFVSWFVKEAVVELQAYGSRRPVNSYFPDNPYYFETRNAAAFQVAPRDWVSVRGFVSVGPNSYPVEVLVGTQEVTRRDDVTEYGGGLSFRLFRNLTASVGLSRSRYSSNIPGVSRTISRLTTGLSLPGEVKR